MGQRFAFGLAMRPEAPCLRRRIVGACSHDFQHYVIARRSGFVADMKFCPAAGIIALTCCFGMSAALSDEASDTAGAPAFGYRAPSPAISALLDAPQTPSVLASPNGRWLAVLARPGRPSIDELARPRLRLAGLRFSPDNLSPPPRDTARLAKLTNRRAPGSLAPAAELGGRFQAIALLDHSGKQATRDVSGITFGAAIMHPSWSPDGKHLAFSAVFPDRTELWVIDPVSARARLLSKSRLNGISGWPCNWRPDSSGLLCRVQEQTIRPAQDSTPSGPVIQEHDGAPAPARTYQDLLRNPHDEALLEHFLTVRLHEITLKGRSSKIGRPGMHINASWSPDGRYILVTTVRRPFSYLVPLARFPEKTEIWDARGKPVYRLADLPLAENVAIGRDSVRTGPRIVAWRSDAPATVYWVSAADGGDARGDSEVRDELFMLAAPFSAKPVRLAQLAQRFVGVQWSTDELALVWDGWWKTRNRRAFAYQPTNSDAEPRKLFDFSIQDAYADPGVPVMQDNAAGFPVLLRYGDGSSIVLDGFGASPEGDQPFLDALDPATGDRSQLWRSQAPYYEKVQTVIGGTPWQFLTLRESLDSPPAYAIRTLGSDELRMVTEPVDPYPALTGMQKELIRYQRGDGVWLSAYLYLPMNYRKEDGPLPGVLWAYPLEYRRASEAGQVTDSPYRFPFVTLRSMLPWLTLGYLVMDEVSMPVVGEEGVEPNDTYVQQIVASAEAAIAEGVRRGVLDPERVVVAGHSYGAFMVANLLAYSDLFRAGIARSGAYNRSLTPFGFQREERTFWQAPELYFRMSPFMQADHIDEPLLLIHGMQDENSGTYPMQSERLYAALKGLGKTSRLVLLPYEGHSYLARESVLHQAWEISQWLEKNLGDSPANDAE